MSTDDEDDALFKALGHRTRRRMVDVLKGGPRTTGMLCELLPELDRCTVMQHLKVLEEAGLVITQKVGRVRLCRLRDGGLEAEAAWIERYRQRWALRFDALDDVVEDLKRREDRDGRKE